MIIVFNITDSVPEENEDTGNHTTYVDVEKIMNNLNL